MAHHAGFLIWMILSSYSNVSCIKYGKYKFTIFSLKDMDMSPLPRTNKYVIMDENVTLLAQVTPVRGLDDSVNSQLVEHFWLLGAMPHMTLRSMHRVVQMPFSMGLYRRGSFVAWRCHFRRRQLTGRTASDGMAQWSAELVLSRGSGFLSTSASITDIRFGMPHDLSLTSAALTSAHLLMLTSDGNNSSAADRAKDELIHSPSCVNDDANADSVLLLLHSEQRYLLGRAPFARTDAWQDVRSLVPWPAGLASVSDVRYVWHRNAVLLGFAQGDQYKTLVLPLEKTGYRKRPPSSEHVTRPFVYLCPLTKKVYLLAGQVLVSIDGGATFERTLTNVTFGHVENFRRAGQISLKDVIDAKNITDVAYKAPCGYRLELLGGVLHASIIHLDLHDIITRRGGGARGQSRWPSTSRLIDLELSNPDIVQVERSASVRGGSLRLASTVRPQSWTLIC
ncbi:uncharacterized protein LOC119106981 [Pollicipes pollicipes]|uniref:uncharacterized protein LOC119106981 n=1 Tax=Pollicipes pollicipes TaxID=41117 RepID=UPI001884F07F|nr:uncharacterized protein LOC119106981 [Pollicipes pollicipes]